MQGLKEMREGDRRKKKKDKEKEKEEGKLLGADELEEEEKPPEATEKGKKGKKGGEKKDEEFSDKYKTVTNEEYHKDNNLFKQEE